MLIRLPPFELEIKLTRRHREQGAEVGYVEPVEDVASRSLRHGIEICFGSEIERWPMQSLCGVDHSNEIILLKPGQRG